MKVRYQIARRAVIVVLLLVLSPCAAVAAAQQAGRAMTTPTRVMVRAVSRDAKVIGTKVGGARITIRDAATGKVLSEGIQTGETGSTEKIIVQPRQRGEQVYDAPGTAGFMATLELERPTVVEVTAEGPLGAPQAVQKVSKTLLLVPGEHVEGDGVVLEIHGLIVTSAPAPAVAGRPFELRATVTLTCGCPTEPNGLWDANRIKVSARVVRGGQVVGVTQLTYAGTVSTYAGQLTLREAGEYELEILASDAAAANFGVARRKLGVAREGVQGP